MDDMLPFHDDRVVRVARQASLDGGGSCCSFSPFVAPVQKQSRFLYQEKLLPLLNFTKSVNLIIS